MSSSGSKATLGLLLLAGAAPALCEIPQSRRTFEVFLDRMTSAQQPGLTPSGLAVTTAPGTQPGFGMRLGWTTDPNRSWAVDYTGGFRLGPLMNVITDGSKPGVSFRSGGQFSVLGGISLRSTGRFEFGLGLEGRATSLVTELDQTGSTRKLVFDPWVRGFAGLWAGKSGSYVRYVRLEAGFNPLASRRTFEPWTFANAQGGPWNDPTYTPSAITTGPWWNQKWYLGMVVGFRPAKPMLSADPAPVLAPPAPAAGAVATLGVAPARIPAKEADERSAEGPKVMVTAVFPDEKPAQPGQEPKAWPDGPGVKNSAPPGFFIHFQRGKSALTHESLVVLDAWRLQIAGSLDKVRVDLTSTSDGRGSAVYREQLSRNRVKTVRKWLRAHGVPAKAIHLVNWEGMIRADQLGTSGSGRPKAPVSRESAAAK